MRYLTYCITIYLLLTNCNTNSADEESRITLEPTSESIYIKLGKREINETALSQYFSDKDSNYLALLNDKYNSIDIYNLDKKVLSYKIRIEKEGTNAFIGKFGFIIKNLDTIVLISNWPPSVAIINTEGKITKRISCEKDENGKFLPFAIPLRGLNGIIKGDILNIVNELSIRQYTGKFTASDHKLLKIVTSVNLKQGNVKILPLDYPEKLIDKDVFNMSKCWEKGYDDNFIFSFSILSDLFVTQDFINYREIPLETDHELKLPENMFKYATDLQGFLNYEKETDAIKDILYDKFRQYYYILIRKHEQELNNNEEYILKNTLYPDCFIIILDKDFKHISEINFPKGVYYFNNMFITKEGLYISEDHVDNPIYSEDALRFRLFKVSKK